MSTIPTQNSGEVYISDRILWGVLEEQICALEDNGCETPAEFIALFMLISGVNDAWRSAVFVGEMPYTAELDKKIKSFFEKWVEVAKQEPADDYKKYLAEGEKIIADWRAPSLTRAVGGRVATLNDAQAATYREIANSDCD